MLLAACCVVVSAPVVLAQTGPVQYGYDELGRLIIVVDGAGNAAIYNYDPVGNLLSIQRIDPDDLGPVAITAVTPLQGTIGSEVSIFGKGFGGSPGQNTVSLNGGVATVTSASPWRLRVTVPPTAQDGPVSVTAAAGSATSAQSFHVIRAFTVTPTGASVSAGGTLQFSALSPDGSAAPVTWAVNNVPWGSLGGGTISVGGLFRPPPYVNVPVVVTITATDQRDATTAASAAATVFPQRLASAGQGVSVSVAKPAVSNLQTSVSAVVGGTSIAKNLQTSASVVIGGVSIRNTLQASTSVVIGGEPSTVATTAMSVSLSPVITSVSPATGARGATGLIVTLTGAGFVDATQVTFLRNNAPDTAIGSSVVTISPDGTQMTLSVSIPGGAVTGARVVKITTPAGTTTVVGTGVNIFTVQ